MRDALEMEDSKRGSGRALVCIAPCLQPKPPGQHPQQQACPSSKEKEVPLGQNLPPCLPGLLSALLRSGVGPPRDSLEGPQSSSQSSGTQIPPHFPSKRGADSSTL